MRSRGASRYRFAVGQPHAAATVPALLLTTLIAAPVLAQSQSTSSDDGGLQSVTVTARYTQENLQTTPLAITAVSGADLEARNFDNVTDLGHAVPNLFITPGDANVGPTPTIAMRGVSAGDYSYAVEPAVGIYIDDVYHNTMFGSALDLNDLERVEVKRGPQGTLSGFANSRVTPEQALRFAKGEPVPFMDKTVQRAEPLDFMAVTDHSENIGVFRDLDDPNSEFSKSPVGAEIRQNGEKGFWKVVGLMTAGKPLPGFDPAKSAQTAWQHEIDAANSQYEPGRFTTFIGYEWSAMPEGKYNLHRNVIFRGSKAPFPFSSLQSKRPEDLWTFLEAQRAQGVEALAISHNANASGGLMFGEQDSYGKPINEAYALRRVLNEPLNEISQGKGQSETHPALSPSDEFAGFEIFDKLLLGNVHSEVHGSYAREALGKGLEIEKRVGANPYKFGVAGGSDFHNGLSTSREDSYGGKVNGTDPNTTASTKEETQAAFAGKGLTDEYFDLIKFGSGNLTAVWAGQNTRESIYDALRRKETFATSGPRIKVRFFGGWDYSRELPKSASWVKDAYANGVPMGNDLAAKPSAAKAPRFVVWAQKDPNGANLDRAQVVKVWLGKDGKYAERVFDVAVSKGRKVDARTGKAAAVESTVDLKTATYRNDVGATEFATVWEDPSFDAAAAAVYYLRVIEIPTPRWSTILAVKRGLPLPADVAPTLQERAWSSAIWFTPAAQVAKR